MKATLLGKIRQVKAALVLSVSIIILGTMIGWPSPVLHDISHHGYPMNLTVTEKSMMVSFLYLGNLVTPLPVGYLMDACGRKIIMMALSVVPLTSWVLIMFSRDALRLCIARFMCGIWGAAVTTVAPMYLCEIAEPKLRGALSTFVQLNMNIGVLFEYTIGLISDYDALALLNLFFPVIFVLLFWNMPESPYWLSMRNRDISARFTLTWLRGERRSYARRISEEIEELNLGIHEEMQHPKNFKDLIATKGHRKALMIVQVLAFAQRMSGITAMMAFMSTTLPEKKIANMNERGSTIVVAIIWLVCVLLATYLVDYMGRKPLLLISSIGCACGTFIVGIWFFFHEKTSIDVDEYYWAPFAGIVVYSIFFSLGLGPLPATEQGEMFSANDKALASAITSMTLALSSYICNQIYLPIAVSAGMFVNYFIFTTVSVLTAIFVAIFVIETKGKTLHQIHDELER